jgi:hypothetical protein
MGSGALYLHDARAKDNSALESLLEHITLAFRLGQLVFTINRTTNFNVNGIAFARTAQSTYAAVVASV